MRTLVTGLDGFTGYYLNSELEAHGHEVVALKSDITEPDAVAEEIKGQKFDFVVHLAAIAFVGHGNANTFYNVNLIGTRNLLEALAAHVPGVKRVLLVSSANIYGNHLQGALTETTIPAPANDYAASKAAMELMAQLWMDRLPLFIVRPFNYTGVGQEDKFLIPKIVSHFRDRKPVIELGNLDVWREFGDVRAVVEAYRRLLAVCPAGDVLNICTGKAHSLREVIGLCEKITGHSIELQVNSAFVRANEVKVLTGDSSHLMDVISEWNPADLEDTLKWMLNDR